MKYLPLIALFALTVGCKEQSVEPIDGQFTIEEKHIQQISSDGRTTLSVDKISNSLCPPNAYCIRGGEAVVDLTASQNGESKTISLCTGPDCQTFQKGKPAQVTISLGNRTWTIQLATVHGPTAPQRAVLNVQIQ